MAKGGKGRAATGQVRREPWKNHRTMEVLWDFFGISIGFLWEFTRFYGILWDFLIFLMGFFDGIFYPLVMTDVADIAVENHLF